MFPISVSDAATNWKSPLITSWPVLTAVFDSPNRPTVAIPMAEIIFINIFFKTNSICVVLFIHNIRDLSFSNLKKSPIND
jgi:hypothetical protein